MIAELVFFDLPKSTTRSQALELYRKTADAWLENPDLVQKYYFFDEGAAIGGGVYIWETREDALRWHGEEYKRRVVALYGSAPRIQIMDVLLHVNPKLGIKNEY